MGEKGLPTCLECGAKVDPFSPMDGAAPEQAAPKEPPKPARSEIQLLKTLVMLQGQWIDIYASAIETHETLLQHQRECDETAPEFFFFELRMNLRLTALHKHAVDLANDARSIRKELKESFPNGY